MCLSVTFAILELAEIAFQVQEVIQWTIYWPPMEGHQQRNGKSGTRSVKLRKLEENHGNCSRREESRPQEAAEEVASEMTARSETTPKARPSSTSEKSKAARHPDINPSRHDWATIWPS